LKSLTMRLRKSAPCLTRLPILTKTKAEKAS
jgi:hypothetical protein